MLFQDRLGRPPSGSIELHNVAIAIVTFESVHPIYVARIRHDDVGKPKIERGLNRLQHEIRRQKIEGGPGRRHGADKHISASPVGIYSRFMKREAVQQYRDQIVGDLAALIKIPSVKGPKSADAPFGPEAARALTYVLKRGEELGFETRNVGNYAGHVQFGTNGPIIGVLCHLDVVPAGDGWNHDPFGGEIEDGVIYGRGAADNKGPAIASLHVLRAFADQVPEPEVRIRLIYGTNEESGMEGVRRYFEVEDVPDLGFSPDAAYPLYNREMGIVNIHLTARRSHDALVSTFSGGTALNMVPDRAKATILPEYSDVAMKVFKEIDANGSVEHRLTCNRSQTGIEVEAVGISAHGGRPANGVNAIAYLTHAITELARATGDTFEPELRALDRLIGFETRGESLGIACRDSESGELSVNWGTIEVSEEKVQAGLNIRYPVTADFDAIVKALEWISRREGYSVRKEHHLEPLFVSQDSALVIKLLSAYKKATGETASPLSMSGGTYARMLENRGVAFGAGFAGEDNNVHKPEENVRIESLMRHAEICLEALFELSSAPEQLSKASS